MREFSLKTGFLVGGWGGAGTLSSCSACSSFTLSSRPCLARSTLAANPVTLITSSCFSGCGTQMFTYKRKPQTHRVNIFLPFTIDAITAFWDFKRNIGSNNLDFLRTAQQDPAGGSSVDKLTSYSSIIFLIPLPFWPMMKRWSSYETSTSSVIGTNA